MGRKDASLLGDPYFWDFLARAFFFFLAFFGFLGEFCVDFFLLANQGFLVISRYF